MKLYSVDRAWSDLYFDAVREIVSRFLIVAAPVELDRNRNTDLMVLHARNTTIAARVRRAGFADVYPYDITIRYRRESGAQTELEKIVAGWGDWMFYGHAMPPDRTQQPRIGRWYLLDLNELRRELLRDGVRVALSACTKYKGAFQLKSNGDRTHFLALDVRRFPSSVLIGSSDGQLVCHGARQVG